MVWELLSSPLFAKGARLEHALSYLINDSIARTNENPKHPDGTKLQKIDYDVIVIDNFLNNIRILLKPLPKG